MTSAAFFLFFFFHASHGSMEICDCDRSPDLRGTKFEPLFFFSDGPQTTTENGDVFVTRVVKRCFFRLVSRFPLWSVDSGGRTLIELLFGVVLKRITGEGINRIFSGEIFIEGCSVLIFIEFVCPEFTSKPFERCKRFLFKFKYRRKFRKI